MEQCPICGKEMYQTIFQFRNEKLCPIHASFMPEEQNASNEYFHFKWDLHRIDALIGAVSLYKKNKPEYIQFLIKQGYSNPEDLIEERVNGYLDLIRIAEIATLKISVERYAKNKEYNHIGEMCIKNEEIVLKHSIQFRNASEAIPSLDLLKSIRDFIVHPNSNPDENMKKLIFDVPDPNDPLSFLYEEILILRNGINKSILFIKNKSQEEQQEFMLKYSESSRSHTSYVTFLDFLREEIQEVILDMDLNGVL
jgi:hypothetical protein